MSIHDRVLITGGAGMLAHALARSLRGRRVEPLVLDRAGLDVSTESAVHEIFEAPARPALVLNCAAYTKVDLCERELHLAGAVNGEAPGRLAAACKQAGALLVHFSTDFVFDGESSRPYRPNDSTSPQSAYGMSKWAGERAVARFGGEWLTIRTAWLYGPGGPNFVQTMLNAARTGKPLTVVNDQTGSPTFTHDLAEITLDLIDGGARGIYHATNSGQTTWFDFTRAIMDEFDVNAQVSPLSSAAWKVKRPDSATRPAYSVLDCSATERAIGRRIPGWRDALHRYRLAVESPSQ